MLCPVCGKDDTPIKHRLPAGDVVHACGACSVEFIHPQPPFEALRDLYNDEYYTAWGIKNGQAPVRALKKATAQYFLRVIQKYKTAGALLDVGCATGYFLEAAQESGFTPYGVDISPFATDIARKTFGAGRVCTGVLAEAPFEKKSFDVIVMIDFLEHTADPLDTLRTARAYLKDDGILFLAVPDTRTLTNTLMGASWTHYKKEHLFYFNRRSIAYAGQAAGFSLAHYRGARKAVSVDYLYHQFQEYKHGILSPLAAMLHHALPGALRNRVFFVPMGESMAVLKKI